MDKLESDKNYFRDSLIQENSIVEHRNRVWKRAKYFMDIMFLGTKILPVSIAKKLLENIRFKVGWYHMSWRYVLLKRIGTEFIGSGYRIIQSNVCIYNPEKLSMGERITINDNTYIECGGGENRVRCNDWTWSFYIIKYASI